MKIKPIEEIQNALQPIADEMSIEIVEIEFKQGKEPALTVYIDIDGGVDLDTCEKFHRAIDPVLDEIDPIEGFYYLEVSSPGVERELRIDEHISHSIGEKVEAKLFAPKDGIKSLVGILSAFEDGIVKINCEGQEYSFARSDISKLKTIYFND